MNKNWLYRVLAVALVAMLALPVFALAEDAVALNEFDAVDEVEVDLGAEGVEAEVKDVESNYYVGDVYIGDFDMLDAEYDGGSDWKVNDVAMIVVDAGQISVSFKSKNKKVASVSRTGDIGVVTFKGSGDVIIEVTAKFKPAGAKSFKLKAFVKFSVDDNDEIRRMESFFGDDFDEDDTFLSGHTYNVTMGEGWDVDTGLPTKVAVPVAYNKKVDGDLLDYGVEDSDDVKYWGGYRWSWSNPDVAYFLPDELNDNYDEDAPVSAWALKQKKGTFFYWYEDETGDLCTTPHVANPIVFNKPGKAKLTFTSLWYPKQKVNMTFNVAKNTKTWKLKKSMIEDDEVYLTIKSITIKNIDEADVVFAVVNGTDNTYGNWTGDVSIQYRKDGDFEDFLVKQDVTLKVKAKPNAITECKKVTFKNEKRTVEAFDTTSEVVAPGVKIDSGRTFLIELGTDVNPWLPRKHEIHVSVNDAE